MPQTRPGSEGNPTYQDRPVVSFSTLTVPRAWRVSDSDDRDPMNAVAVGEPASLTFAPRALEFCSTHHTERLESPFAGGPLGGLPFQWVVLHEILHPFGWQLACEAANRPDVPVWGVAGELFTVATHAPLRGHSGNQIIWLANADVEADAIYKTAQLYVSHLLTHEHPRWLSEVEAQIPVPLRGRDFTGGETFRLTLPTLDGNQWRRDLEDATPERMMRVASDSLSFNHQEEKGPRGEFDVAVSPDRLRAILPENLRSFLSV